MALYRPLTRCLVAANRRGETSITISFAEIEDMLGFRLSHNALTNPDWWLQDEHGHHAWTRSWQRAGWNVKDVHIEEDSKGGDKNKDAGTVIFIRTKRPMLRAHIDFEIQERVMPFLDNVASKAAPTLERGDAAMHEWVAPRVMKARDWLAPRLSQAYNKTVQGIKQAQTYYVESGLQMRLNQGVKQFWQQADRLADWLGSMWQNLMAKRQNKKSDKNGQNDKAD